MHRLLAGTEPQALRNGLNRRGRPASLPGFNVPQTAIQATDLIRSSFYDKIELLEQLLEKTAMEISAEVGIFCVSKRYDSLPMWAHYAANAAGLIVEFVELEKPFGGDATGVLWQPIDVRYERENTSVTFEPRSHEVLFFEKFKDWSYEQEVRVVAPLENCKSISGGGRKLYLYSIPTTCITRLILGWKMDRKVASEIRSQVRNSGGPVKVVSAEFTHGRVVIVDPENWTGTQ